MIVDLFAGPGGAPGECWEGAGSDNGNGYRTVRVDGSIKQRMCRECGRERLRRRRAAAKEVMPNG